MNKAGTQTIETERLILRRFTADDAQAMFDNWAGDPVVNEFMTWPVHSDVSVTKELLCDWVSKYADGTYFNWVIEYRSTKEVIGNISVVRLDEMVSSAEIGYCMSKSFWGQGIMPEALRAVRDYLFDVIGINRICACHDTRNSKSGRVMDKAGMKPEGVLRQSKINNLGVYDVAWHSILRSEREAKAELDISLTDYEWPFEGKDYDRHISRAIVFDDEGYFYFVRANRDDDFGKATLIETAGGGIEKGEDPGTAIIRELSEELGADVEVLGKIGVVSDYYNLIGRHNINNYFLCKVRSFGDKNLTQQEIEDFHLSTLKVTYEEALAEYDLRRQTKIGRLVANRELPVLMRAKEMIAELNA